MRRSRIIVIAVLLGLLGAAIPLVAVWLISWERAVHKEQDALEPFAQRALLRASGTFVAARAALAELEAMSTPRCSQATFPPCGC